MQTKILTQIIILLLLLFPFQSFAIKADTLVLNNNSKIKIKALLCFLETNQSGIITNNNVQEIYDLNIKESKVLIDESSINKLKNNKSIKIELHIVPSNNQNLYAYSCKYSNPIKKFEINKFPSELNFDCDCQGDLDDINIIQYIPTPIVNNEIEQIGAMLDYERMDNRYICFNDIASINSGSLTVIPDQINNYSINFITQSIQEGDPCLSSNPKTITLKESEFKRIKYYKNPIEPVKLNVLEEINKKLVNNTLFTTIKSKNGICINSEYIINPSNQYALSLNDKVNYAFSNKECTNDTSKEYILKNLDTSNILIYEDFEYIENIEDVSLPTQSSVYTDRIGNYCIDNNLVTVREITDQFYNRSYLNYQFEVNKSYSIKYLASSLDCNLDIAPELIINIEKDKSILLSPILYLDFSGQKCKFLESNITPQPIENSKNNEIYLNNQSNFDVIATPCYKGKNLFNLDENNQTNVIYNIIKSKAKSKMIERMDFPLRSDYFNEFMVGGDTNGIFDAEFFNKNEDVEIKIYPYFKEFEENQFLIKDFCENKKAITFFKTPTWSNTYDFDCNCTIKNNGNLDYSIILEKKEKIIYSLINIFSNKFYSFCINNRVYDQSVFEEPIFVDTIKVNILPEDYNSITCENNEDAFELELQPYHKYTLNVKDKLIALSNYYPYETIVNQDSIDKVIKSQISIYENFEVCINGDPTNTIKSDDFEITYTPYTYDELQKITKSLKIGDRLSMLQRYPNPSNNLCSEAETLITENNKDIDFEIKYKDAEFYIYQTKDLSTQIINDSFIKIRYNFVDNTNSFNSYQDINKICINDILQESIITTDAFIYTDYAFKLAEGENTISIPTGDKCISNKSFKISSEKGYIYQYDLKSIINSDTIECVLINKEATTNPPKVIPTNLITKDKITINKLPRTGAQNNLTSIYILIILIFSILCHKRKQYL
jgi:hypothetical protein